MSFKYFNPGFPGLLDTTGGVLVEDEKCSRTGASFYQTDKYKGITLSSHPAELYCKFDFFLFHDETSTNYNIYVQTNYPSGNGIVINKSDYYIYFYYLAGNSTYTIGGNRQRYAETIRDNLGLLVNQVNTIYFHCKMPSSSSADDGLLEIYANGKLMVSTSKYVGFHAADREMTLVLSSNNAVAPLSNIIVSDEPFDKRESLVRVPLKSVTTDMKDNGDGTYTATEAGQTLLQELDVPALIEAHGGTSDVTAILSVASPAYRTDALNVLTHIEKSGDTLTEYESAEVGTYDVGAVRTVHPVTMKAADLAGLSVGWKAGTK